MLKFICLKTFNLTDRVFGKCHTLREGGISTFQAPSFVNHFCHYVPRHCSPLLSFNICVFYQSWKDCVSYACRVATSKAQLVEKEGEYSYTTYNTEVDKIMNIIGWEQAFSSPQDLVSINLLSCSACIFCTLTYPLSSSTFVG